MGYFLFILVLLLAGLWYFQQWSRQAGPERTRKALKTIGISAAVVLALGLAIRSGSVLLGLLPVLAVAFNRIISVFALLTRWPGFTHWLGRFLQQRMNQTAAGAATAGASHQAGANAGRASTINTQYFTMTLNQASGEFDGTVRTGPHQGAKLSGLDLNTLLAMYRDVADDPQSQAVLEAFLDFRFGEQWRSSSSSDNVDVSLDQTMTPAQAYAILGLQTGASTQEIRQAHRRLSQRLHPDQGGNDALCSLINQARDVLLKT